VAVEQRFIGRKPNTNISLTKLGRRRIEAYWAEIDRLQEL